MKTKVISSRNKDGLWEVELEHSIFYPGGGGQPCDTGFLEADGFLGEVLFVKKEGGKIIHLVKYIRGAMGKEVEMKINQERRKKLMKMHTAEHLLFKALQKIKKEIKLIKIDLDETESSLFVEAKDISLKDLFKAEQLANEIITQGKEIREFKVKKSETGQLIDLRINKERIREEEVRIVEIDGYDRSACAGTHCNSTKEVGHLLITNLRGYGSNQFEIRFKTGNLHDLLNLSRYAREAAKILETTIEDIPESVAKLKKKVEEYKEKLRRTVMQTETPVEKWGGHNIISKIFEDADQKQLTEKGNSLMSKADIVIFINKKEGWSHVLLFTNLLNASALLSELLEKIPGKGGGKEKFAMGGFRADPPLLIKELKHIICGEKINKE